MPNDNLMFPPRFIGYGAYNFCFDRDLGKSPLINNKDFFQFIHARWPAINLVRVICFRQATLEGLPPITYDAQGLPNGRTQPLFKRNKTINPNFLNTLLALVRRAKEFNFWVQVCLFHEQAVKANSGGFFETPENCPKILDGRDPSMGANNCQRLTNFFNITDTTRLNAQLNLVQKIASTLKLETNVLYEIANEVRIQGCSAADNTSRNCKVLPWLNRVSDKIASAISPKLVPDGTSTGTTNEAVTFNPTRPFQGCTEQPLQAAFHDFHSGQWKASDNATIFKEGIDRAKLRALKYMNLPSDSPRVPLIINDDGQNWVENNDNDKRANAARIKKWATYAFKKGLSYASKQQYPPAQPLDTFALDALQQANDSVPIPQ